MTEPHVFVLAEHALTRVVNHIRDDQWTMVMPPEFAVRAPTPTITLREIINYHAYDDAWVPDMLAGKTMAETGQETFQGDLLGDTPQANFATIVERACAAATALDDLDRTVHCSFGDFTARQYFWQLNYFRGVRAYTIAKALGIDPTLPDPLVQGLWEELRPHAEEWRAIGVFGPPVTLPPDASLQDQLLALTGQHP